MFNDTNDDGLRSANESGAPAIPVSLFRCGNQDGLIRTEFSSQPGGITNFVSVDPGFYQISVEIPDSFDFSSPTFDDSGNATSTIRAVVRTDPGWTGYSACTDFTDGRSQFPPVGLIRRR